MHCKGRWSVAVLRVVMVMVRRMLVVLLVVLLVLMVVVAVGRGGAIVWVGLLHQMPGCAYVRRVDRSLDVRERHRARVSGSKVSRHIQTVVLRCAAVRVVVLPRRLCGLLHYLRGLAIGAVVLDRGGGAAILTASTALRLVSPSR